MSIRVVPSIVLACLASSGALSAGEGVVALQSAAPSCAVIGQDAIYEPCDNGTVTDIRTGLVWLANANCFGELDWHEATAVVQSLSDIDDDLCTDAQLTPAECDCGLSDGSSPGEWRLPSPNEWKAMVADGDASACSPAITNDFGTACWSEACVGAGLCSFSDVRTFYWSANSHSPGYAWIALARHPVIIDAAFKDDTAFVWPVRSGQ